MEKKRFRRKYVLRLLSSPWTRFPILGGVILGCVGAIANVPLAFLGAFVSFAAGTGHFVAKLFAGDTKTAVKIQEELDQEAEKEAEARLDNLDERLAADEYSTADENCLRDLRTLMDVYKNSASWKKNINKLSQFDIFSNVNEIFKLCIDRLELSLEVGESMKRAATDKIRNSFKQRRDKIIKSVQDSIDDLNKTLGDVQEISMSSRDGKDKELLQKRKELEKHKRILMKVDAWKEGIFSEENDLSEFEIEN